MMKYLDCQRYTTLLLPCLLVFSLLTASLSHAQDDSFNELPLNGLAPYVQLRKEYYIGALFMESLSKDPIVALHGEVKKRMDLRITIDSLSPRLFSQQWNQLILINNEQAVLEQFADSILAFVDMPKSDLVQGDQITIDSHPESGVTIYLNQQKMFTEPDTGFFKVLLNTWIGPRPPSSGFKNDILLLATDQAGTELLVRYENLNPTAARQKQVAGWQQKPKPAVEEVAKERNRAIAPPSSETTVTARRQRSDTPATVEKDIVIAQPALGAPKPTIEIEKLSLQQPSAGEAGAKPASAPAATAKPVEDKPSPASPAPQPAPKPSQELAGAAKSLPAPASAPANPAPAAKATTVKDEQESLKAVYRSNILKLIYLNTQYPKRAMDFRQEGLVELVIKVSRSGKVLDITEKTRSEHRLLNKAAKVAVMKTEPFPEPPNDLKGDEIEIVLPFNFQL